jgi:hypothetical protein
MVDHAVEDGARGVVAVVPRPQQLAAELGPQLLEVGLVQPVALRRSPEGDVLVSLKYSSIPDSQPD